MFQAWIGGLRIDFALPLRFINSDELLFAPGVLSKTIIRDSVKPCREARFPAKAVDVPVSPDECLLREIVGQGEVISGKLTQQSADTRLMTTNQLAKSVLVIINKNSSDKVGIGELHARRLG